MNLFGPGRKRKNSTGNRIRKLTSKINAKNKKLAQKKKLQSLQSQWNKMRGY